MSLTIDTYINTKKIEIITKDDTITKHNRPRKEIKKCDFL